MKIADNVCYVGVNDRRTSLFEGLWTLPYGVSYNSYLVTGEQTSLIDTVEEGFTSLFLKNIADALEGRKLNYLVVNHMEPDHSSSIEAVRRAYPEVTVVGNAKTVQMLQGFYGITDRTLQVADGQTLSLGSTELAFHLTPMVHWPETMMTLMPAEKILFSGDAFGCFGALQGNPTDVDIDADLYFDQMYRYYAAIVGKYGVPVQNAMKKLADKSVATICPTHGPVWQRHAGEMLEIYSRLSRYEGERGTVIVYGTMYGNNAHAADYIARGLASRGEKNIRVYDLSTTDLATILADIFRYDTLVVGCPTYNGEIFPPADNLMRALAARMVTGKRFGAFGSFCWAGAAVKKLREAAESMKFDIVEPSAEFKQGFDQNPTEQFDLLVEALSVREK